MFFADCDLFLGLDLADKKAWSKILMKRGQFMKFDHSFRHHDVSQSLMSYVEDRMKKLLKYEMKPTNAHVRYSMEKHRCSVEVNLVGGNGRLKANHQEKDWHVAVDGVVQKLEKQMKKLKDKTKDHKHPAETKHGRLQLVTEELETDYQRLERLPAHRKVS